MRVRVFLIFTVLHTAPCCNALSSPSPKVSSSTHRLNRRAVLGNFFAVSTFVSSNSIANAETTDEGVSFITGSNLGKSIRRSAIQGARVIDNLDEKWERFSDSLRDESKCDENTGRRLYDNGFRKDGTRVGNPVLGALCKPEPLLPLDRAIGDRVLDLALGCALEVGGGESSVGQLQKIIQDTENLVRPSFERTLSSKDGNDEEKARILYNFAFYSRMRAISTYLNNNAALVRKFQLAWGKKLALEFASSANRNDYVSPFPEMKDEFEDYDYDKNDLLDSLGVLKVSLDKLKNAGIIGHFEISIPYDDYGSVVTVAIDDYVPIGSEILLSEQSYGIGGIGQSLVRSALNEAKIDFGLDTFYIDPTTTKQNEYNPNQLLLSLNNLRKR